MRFDYTHGKEARYVVVLYSLTGFSSDHYYFHEYRKAKEFFKQACETEQARETESTVEAISVYDMKRDIRKDFCRISKEQE